MKIYSFSNLTYIIILTSYLYLYIPYLNYVISYVIHDTIKNNFINFASGIYCLKYINKINLTQPEINNNYLIHGLTIIILNLSYIQIYCNVCLSGINLCIYLIQLISKKIIQLSLYVNISVSQHFITIIDDILKSIINISDINRRENIYDMLSFIRDNIFRRMIQIEVLNSLEENHQINGVNGVNGGVNGVNGVNDVNGGINTFESFVEELNNTYPLRCRGLENNNNDDRIDSNICNICLEDLDYNQLYRTINCSHSFHPHCIDRWLFQSNYCPICRTQINLR